MLSSAASEQLSPEAPERTDSAMRSSISVPDGAARIDFALVAGDRFLVHGWILGLASAVSYASVQFGNVTIDLLSQAARVRRPDVAQHFSRSATDDLHGFHALVDLPEGSLAADQLCLRFVLLSGEAVESFWPVRKYGDPSGPAPESVITTLRGLIRQLPRIESRRLVNFLPAEERSKLGIAPSLKLPPPIRLEIELCGILEDRILVIYGWMFDPAGELKSVKLKLNEQAFDLFESAVSVPQRDIQPDPPRSKIWKAAKYPGFLLVKAIAPEHAATGEIRLSINADSDDPVLFTHPICMNAHDSRQQLFALIDRLDVESVLVLTGRIASVLEGVRELTPLRELMELSHDHAVERLPISIRESDPKVFLHIDQSVAAGGEGLFLSGWFYSESERNPRIECHCGSATFEVTNHWIRTPRMDVVSHLTNLGIQVGGCDFGFTSYAPIKCGDRPYYLSVALKSGETKRMRVPIAAKAQSALQTVRALLSSFDCSHRELRTLLDRQVGPAVQAVWSARAKPEYKVFSETFGARETSPAVSIVVPLFGRCDFAEYQMALFADDEDFQRTDLIYVVDDPAIIDAFRVLCPNLLGIYQVPFTVVYPGVNLGFAGANNLGVERARAPLTLFLNSDVLPKRRGWVSELLRVHASLKSPGLVGAKLLYEDGTLQHAGMAFRMHSPWGGLWINDHPLKGQNPTSITGTRQVDAVTAACALIETSLFRDLGGFSEDYIVGDFEDSDLCLRARMAGRRNYVALDVELYHLERQSQQKIGSSELRSNLTAYNCWLHNQRWSQVMEESSMSPFLPATGDAE